MSRPRRRLPSRLAGLILLPLALPLAGCAATGAGAAAMVPEPSASPACAAAGDLVGAVALGRVGGGEETAALGTSKVSDGNLAEAVRRTLDLHGLLSADPAQAPYRLDVFLVDLNQPRASLTTEVITFVRYRLVAVPSETTLLDDVVQASYELDAGDVFYGAKRMRIVNEGSVRSNLAGFMDTLCARAASGALATSDGSR